DSSGALERVPVVCKEANMEDSTTVQVAQDKETPLRMGERGLLTWRYAYARAAESSAAHQPGQDYLTFRRDHRTLVFALCDGVGQSFCGDIAARMVGDTLIEWLWRIHPAETDARSLQDELHATLIALTQPASQRVHAHPLPPDFPALLREVLE